MYAIRSYYDHPRPCKTEKGVAGLNDKTALSRKIASAAGIETEHAHDAGDNTADLAQGGEGLGIPVKTTHPGGDIGPGTA